jgi:hypothetical protein
MISDGYNRSVCTISAIPNLFSSADHQFLKKRIKNVYYKTEIIVCDERLI